MKKILSMLLACMCLCTNLVMASNEPSQSTNVTLDMPTSYTWKAPASLELSEASPVTGTVEVTENVIPEGSKLVISLAAENNFTVTSDEGATRTYSITKDSTTVNAGDTIMEVAAGTNTASQALNFSVESVSGKKAGTFKGTANFTAKVKIPLYSMVTDADSNGAVSKGDIISLNGVDLGSTSTTGGSDSTTDTFRVLSVDGSNVTLLAMDVYKKAYFGSNNTYSGSTLNTEMTNYYNALPSDVKAKIVAQNIVQSKYSFSNPMSATNRSGENPVGSRSVYALDVDDVIEYLGSDYTAYPCTALREMFFNTTESVYRWVWLRSANAGDTYDAFRVFGYDGDVNRSCVNDYKSEVRPAFVINLG